MLGNPLMNEKDGPMVEKENFDDEYEYEINVEETSVEPVRDEYLDDDEAFLAGDDVVLVEKDVLSIFKQSENVVSYELLNYYGDNGKPRSRMSMRNDPPILHISSSDNKTVDFVLTQHFTKHMVQSLKEIDKSYSGIPSKKKKELDQEEIENVFQRLVSWVKNNKVRAGVLVAFVLLLVIYNLSLSF